MRSQAARMRAQYSGGGIKAAADCFGNEGATASFAEHIQRNRHRAREQEAPGNEMAMRWIGGGTCRNPEQRANPAKGASPPTEMASRSRGKESHMDRYLKRRCQPAPVSMRMLMASRRLGAKRTRPARLGSQNFFFGQRDGCSPRVSGGCRN